MEIIRLKISKVYGLILSCIMHWFCGIHASKDTQNLNIKRTFSFVLFTHIIKVLENFQILKSWSHFTRTANSRTKCSEDTKVTTCIPGIILQAIW